jgi:hypothetical protein
MARGICISSLAVVTGGSGECKAEAGGSQTAPTKANARRQRRQREHKVKTRTLQKATSAPPENSRGGRLVVWNGWATRQLRDQRRGDHFPEQVSFHLFSD